MRSVLIVYPSTGHDITPDSGTFSHSLLRDFHLPSPSRKGLASVSITGQDRKYHVLWLPGKQGREQTRTYIQNASSLTVPEECLEG